MIKISKNIEELIPYKAGKPIQEIRRELQTSQLAKLASNENSFGPSPKALNAITDALNELHWYPEPSALDACKILARYNGVNPENIMLANGSESILSYILKAFTRYGDELITSNGTFIGVYVLAKIYDLDCRRVPLTKEYSFDLEAIFKQISDKTKVIYLANPNNPTGTMISESELNRFIQKVPKDILIILDEAYAEFAIAADPCYPISQKVRADNVIVLRTFSKAYGLAGMRIGYCIANDKITETLMKIKLPFEPSVLAQKAGIAAIDDTDFLNQTIENNNKGLRYFYEQFTDMAVNYVHSYANFIMLDLKTEEKVNQLTKELFKGAVIVRPLAAFGLPNAMRITVGTMEENTMAIDAFKRSYHG